jgi:hypothetical protein
MRSISVAITSLFVLVGIAALLQFLLVFPHRRPWLNRSFGKKLLYFPALLLWLLIAYRVLFTPPATSGLNTLTNFMAGIIIGGYVLFSLFQVLRNYSRTDKTERKALALNSMLLGTVVGFLPVAIAQLVTAFSPQSMLPGQVLFRTRAIPLAGRDRRLRVRLSSTQKVSPVVPVTASVPDHGRGVVTVDEAVIERRRQVHHQANNDLAIANHGTFDRLVDPNDSHFRQVNDGGADHTAQFAQAGQGNG